MISCTQSCSFCGAERVREPGEFTVKIRWQRNQVSVSKGPYSTPTVVCTVLYAWQLDQNRDYNRDTQRLLEQAEKSDHFLGKIEEVSSLPVVYLPCIEIHKCSNGRSAITYHQRGEYSSTCAETYHSNNNTCSMGAAALCKYHWRNWISQGCMEGNNLN